MEAKWDALCRAINAGDPAAALAAARDALEDGESPLAVFVDCVEPCLADIGDRFGRLEVFLPELMLAADVVKGLQEELLPLLQAEDSQALGKGRVVIGTIFGDIHDIGKSIVGALVEAGGLNVIDLGTNVEVESFVNVAREQGSCVIGLSALLTTTMTEMKAVLDALSKAGLREQVRVAVGGAPVTQAFADEIGADGYAEDGMSAMHLIQDLAGSLDAASGKSAS